MSATKCEFCGGSGYLNVKGDPTSRVRCKCFLESMYRSKIGNEIMDAKQLATSAYTKIMDKNLFITANRRDILPHMRYCLISKGLNFFSRVTNDSQMLDAWLSKEKGHTKDTELEDARDFTSLRDLVEEPELLVIFLGVVSYPNRALPGVLLEALRIRSFSGKPTWVVNPHHIPFSSGHLCWSPEVGNYISENMEERAIAPSAAPVVVGATKMTDYTGLS